MKASELNKKTLSELRVELENLHKEQFNLRVQKAVGQAAKTDQFSRVRKDIARVNTVINEKMRTNP